jgi:hypothetical protein
VFSAADHDPDFPAQYRLSWKDRSGQTNATYSTSARAVSSPSASLWGSVHFFEVNAVIDATFGISSFVVDWAYTSQVPLTHSDNGGTGFPFQDVALYQDDQSCRHTNGTTTAYAVVSVSPLSFNSQFKNAPSFMQIRNDMGPITDAYIDSTSNINQVESISVKQVTTRTPLVHAGNSSFPLYDTYSATYSVLLNGVMTDEGRITFDVVAVIGGQTYASLNNPEIFTLC